MKEVIYSRQFLRASLKLSKNIHNKLDELISIVATNPFHSLLHTKQLSGDFEHLYSFRITRDWRVIFSIESNDTIKLLDVAHRKDIYR